MSLRVKLYYPVPDHPDPEARYEVWEHDITHNLGRMARHVGLYDPMWRPEEMVPPVTTSDEALPLLVAGLDSLRARVAEVRQYEPPNGWGTVVDLLLMAERYIEACRQFPKARIWTWR